MNRRSRATFEHQGNGEILVLPIFEDVLGFGLTEGQLKELAAITPNGENEIAALLVDEVQLKVWGRWAGEPPPMRRRRI
jgi:hypothetical protein